MKIGNWAKSGLKFLSTFIAVIAAFALNHWNENRRDDITEDKILMEIDHGLDKDLVDIKLNIEGHNVGISACNYYQKIFAQAEVETDSALFYYMHLTRDFISIQNTAGYETLKSKGLELIKNDSLRLQIISLYEYDYNILRKFEEEYAEMQFYDNYFTQFNSVLSPHFELDSSANIIGLKTPVEIETKEKKEVIFSLLTIKSNRSFILYYYADVENKIRKIKELLKTELDK